MWRTNRRQFLQTAAGASLLGLGDLNFLTHLPPVSASEAKVPEKMVQNRPEIEPLVRLLETTPRNKLLEAVAEKIRAGTSYQQVLAALLLAGVRNVQPRPSVGFKFHAVLVVNSAHIASLASSDDDRWLPIFWALDYYKGRQLEEERASGWKLAPVDESAVPPAHRARAEFIKAMDNWDVDAADAAIASLTRNAGANEVFDLLYRYGCRDYRSIGHKAIYVANSQRTLSTIGWRHAEPVLRSLVYAMLNHSGEANPAESDHDADRPGRANLDRVAQFRDDWLTGKTDRGASEDLLEVLRDGSPDDASAKALALVNDGISPQSIWDAVLLSGGELLMRQPGIVGLHSLTTANALYYAWLDAGDDQVRRYAMLQACSFLPMFLQSARAPRRGQLRDRTIANLQPLEMQAASAEEGIEEIFADVSGNRMDAAQKILTWLDGKNAARDLIAAARKLIFLKGNDAHDYKFSSAVLEDYYHVSPELRDRYLAMSVFNLRGSGDRDNNLVERTRAALG